jgi:hypothetical protein
MKDLTVPSSKCHIEKIKNTNEFEAKIILSLPITNYKSAGVRGSGTFDGFSPDSS